MNAIEVSNLFWRYEHSQKWALTDVSLEIAEQEFVLVIGPNEAGKTTLVSAIKGLIPNSFTGVLKGEVRLFDRRLEDMIEERVRWATRLTGVEDLLDKPPCDISGGQKQRVAIASVIAMQPRILILDEPTSMIDPLGKDQVVNICAELKREYDMTLIVVEHNIEAFAPLADKVVVVNEGRIERVGPPAELFSDLDFLLARDVHPPQVAEVFERLRQRGMYEGDLPLTDDAGVALGRELLEVAR